VTVHIPSPLRSYSHQKSEVTVDGETVADILRALDRQYPGIRFRMMMEQDTIRPHVRIFVNDRQISTLAAAAQPDDRVHIICALSGG
jgi:molybdopterin converting factor small subunit